MLFFFSSLSQIHTPKLIGGASEGGSNVFKLNYFDQPACLAQSPQLYKQMACACGGLDRLVIIGASYLYCTVLRCGVLCCAVLCCAVLCCAVLYCVVLCCVVLCSAVLCCAVSAVLYCAALCYAELTVIMGTADGSPKKDLVLTRAAMPKPVDFVVGRFRARGILQHLSSWALLGRNQGMPECSVAVEFHAPCSDQR